MRSFYSVILWVVSAFLFSCNSDQPNVLYGFDGKEVPDAISKTGSGTLSVENGRLIARSGAGALSMRIPVGAGLRCMAFEDVLVSENSKVGDTLVWKWIVTDSAGIEYPILESRWEHTNSTAYVTQKKNNRGETVQVRVTISNETVSRFRPFRVAFDRRIRNGREEVQLEFRDKSTNRIKKLFPWADPPLLSNVAFEIITNLPEFSIGQIVGKDEHEESELPEFSQEEFKDIPYEEYSAGQLQKRTEEP